MGWAGVLAREDLRPHASSQTWQAPYSQRKAEDIASH